MLVTGEIQFKRGSVPKQQQELIKAKKDQSIQGDTAIKSSKKKQGGQKFFNFLGRGSDFLTR